MSLREDVLKTLKARRQRLIDGSINTIPSPFKRFSKDFLGLEQGTYYLITSYTKAGKSQFVSYLLFEALLYCYINEKKTGVSIKVIYFPLEETPERIMTRFQSYLLMIKRACRISPSDLRSSNNEKPLPEEILNLLENDEELVKIQDYFEEHVIFSTESNPTGIYKVCKQYAEEHGTTYTRPTKYRDDMGVLQEAQVFDYYIPNNPNEYVFPLIDTINLVKLERGFTKKQAIDKLSEYLATELRNHYNMSPIVIQQQSVENESIENVKMNRTRPNTSGLGDSKYTARDCNIALGIFSPAKFGLENYLTDEHGIGYDIKRLKDNFRTLETLVNRDGELGGIVGLFFDGATCTWSELPRPTQVGEMNNVYNYINKIRND
jgi:hypothetical protein